MYFLKHMRRNQSSGFTLVELLIVIAIIGILSSVIFTNINSARRKARDATVKAQLRQFQTILSLEFHETGSYANLQPDLWFPENTCQSSFAGTFANQARQICTALIPLGGTWGIWGAPYKLYAGNAVDPVTRYSLMVPLSSKNTFFCIGSSGSSDTETAGSGSFDATGCYDNP